MSDAIDDMIAMRLAGSGPPADDTEYQYPPHPWAAQPGAMPSMGDVVDRMHRAEARVSVLESQHNAEIERRRAALAALSNIIESTDLDDGHIFYVRVLRWIQKQEDKP